MKTKVLTGPFAEPEYRYKKVNLNFKTACDRLEQGHELVCLRTGERLSMTQGVITVNFDELDSIEFVAKYNDEVFHDCLDAHSNPDDAHRA